MQKALATASLLWSWVLGVTSMEVACQLPALVCSGPDDVSQLHLHPAADLPCCCTDTGMH